MFFYLDIGDIQYIINCPDNTFSLFHTLTYELESNNDDSDYNELVKSLSDLAPLYPWELVIKIDECHELQLIHNINEIYVRLVHGKDSARVLLSENEAIILSNKIITTIHTHHQGASIKSDGIINERHVKTAHRWPLYSGIMETYVRPF